VRVYIATLARVRAVEVRTSWSLPLPSRPLRCFPGKLARASSNCPCTISTALRPGVAVLGMEACAVARRSGLAGPPKCDRSENTAFLAQLSPSSRVIMRMIQGFLYQETEVSCTCEAILIASPCLPPLEMTPWMPPCSSPGPSAAPFHLVGSK